MNYVAILVSAVIYVVIGSVWYSPMFFSKKWIKLNNIDSKVMKNAGAGMYIMPLISAVVTSFVLAWLINIIGLTMWPGGAMVGLMAWGGFAASTQFLNWAFSGKKLGAFLIDTGYQFISFILMGALLAQWR